MTPMSCYCRHQCRASIASLMHEKYSMCAVHVIQNVLIVFPRVYKGGWQGIPVHFPRFSPLAGAIQREINLARINRAKRCACPGAVRVMRATWRRRDRNMHSVWALHRVAAVRIMNSRMHYRVTQFLGIIAMYVVLRSDSCLTLERIKKNNYQSSCDNNKKVSPWKNELD